MFKQPPKFTVCWCFSDFFVPDGPAAKGFDKGLPRTYPETSRRTCWRLTKGVPRASPGRLRAMVQLLFSYFQGFVPGWEPPLLWWPPSNSFGNIQTKAARTLMGESSGAPFQEARQVSGSPPDPREKHACSGRLLLASLSQGGTSTPRNGPHWN